MSLLGKIFDFIKGLVTRSGLHTFLSRYQHKAIEELERLAEVHSGKGLNEWWDEAFNGIKAMIGGDVANVRDNWIAIVINLGWEVIKAEQERKKS